MLIYTSDGHVAVVITHAGRRPLSADRLAAPADERAEAFATSFSYAGSFSAVEDEVRHEVQVASVPNWVGIELVRKFRLEGNTLVLRTPSTLVEGSERVTELVWERITR